MLGFLPIGRFSRLTRLSVRTLRRYDEQGLLVPALVDPLTGRRSYSPAQAQDAWTIRLLRDLDLPLAQVREIVGDRTSTGAEHRLLDHRRRVAQELAHRVDVLAALDALIGDPAPLTVPAVERRAIPEQIVAAVRLAGSLPELGTLVGATLARIGAHLHEVAPGLLSGPALAIYHGDGFDPEAVDVELALPLQGWARVGRGIDVRLLGSVEAVCTLHHGPYETIGAAYQSLAVWAHRHQLELGEEPREIYLVGPDRAGPQGLRTEVVWPLDVGTPAGPP